MKRLSVLATALTLLCGSAFAERPDSPQPSPWQKIEQQVGASFIEMEYSRPGVKGRVIWGELVPYDELWRAGANERTVISFSDDVKINGETLEAGDYGLLILPTEEEWTFIFTRVWMAHGTEDYDPEQDALRVTVTPEEAPFEEWMRFEFTEIDGNDAQVNLRWENIRCGFTVEFEE